MDDMLRVLIFVVGLMGAGVAVYAAVVVVSALQQRLNAKFAPPGLPADEVDALHSRLAATEARVAELEERVDFAERLLAPPQGTDALPGGSRADTH